MTDGMSIYGRKRMNDFVCSFDAVDQRSPMISIICPIYQAGKKLRECINSIIGQTFSDWQLILVIDGSTDGSENIAREYEKEDSRCMVITQTNRGRSAARNTGIDYATGKWIAFIDADDIFLPDGLETLMQAAEQRSEVVYGDYIRRSQRSARYNQEVACFGSLDIEYAKTAALNFERLSFSDDGFRYDLYNCRVCWAKLYLRETIVKNNIRFPEALRIGEDAVFNYCFLSNASRAAYTNAQIYEYNDLNEGTVRSFSYKDFISVRNMADLFEKNIKNDEDANDFRACVARDYLGVFMRASKYTDLRHGVAICRQVKEITDDFILDSLPFYTSKGMQKSFIKRMYNTLRIILIRRKMWLTAFLFQKLGANLK